MNKLLPVTLILAMAGAVPAMAQSTSTSPPASVSPAAVAASGPNNTTAAPVAGANSFTMAQAQKRIEEKGYTQVSALTKDEKSIWRGAAMKDGKAVTVAVDYQGNITANQEPAGGGTVITR